MKPLIALVVAASSTLAAHATQPGSEIGEFDSAGVKIRYVTAGDGEAVILIHGWMSDATMWGKDAAGNPRLSLKEADGFRFIAFDCRGHGKSGAPHDIESYGPEMAADVVRLMDHLKIDKAHLVGYSSGAFIAAKVVATHPTRIRSVVYAGQAPLLKSEGTSAEARPATEVEVFAKAVEDGKGLGSYLQAVMPADRPKLTDEQAEAMARWMFAGKDVRALAAAGRSFPRLGVTPAELAVCQAPILFLHGERESAAVKDAVAAARERLGRGEVKLVPGGDHLTTLLKPEFRDWLLTFLRRTSQPAR